MKSLKNKYFASICSVLLVCTTSVFSQNEENSQEPVPSKPFTESVTPAHPALPENPVSPPTHSNGFSPHSFEENKNEDTYFFYQLLNMLFALVSIVLLILIASWVLKRMMNTRIQQINTNSLIKILERRSLTPKTAIYLLEINGRDIVIAESSNGVTLLNNTIENQPPTKASDFEKVLNEKNQ